MHHSPDLAVEIRTPAPMACSTTGLSNPGATRSSLSQGIPRVSETPGNAARSLGFEDGIDRLPEIETRFVRQVI